MPDNKNNLFINEAIELRQEKVAKITNKTSKIESRIATDQFKNKIELRWK